LSGRPDIRRPALLGTTPLRAWRRRAADSGTPAVGGSAGRCDSPDRRSRHAPAGRDAGRADSQRTRGGTRGRGHRTSPRLPRFAEHGYLLMAAITTAGAGNLRTDIQHVVNGWKWSDAICRWRTRDVLRKSQLHLHL